MYSVPSTVVLALIENGLSFAVFGAVGLSLVMSLLFLFTRGGGGSSAYDHIGAGGLSRESDYAGAPALPAPDSPAAQAEREREIRQMLSARSERLVRRGQPALDVDAEIARLLGGSPPEGDASSREGEADQGARTPGARDAELLAEVRQLVLARNERRVRQGQEPLDVEAEVARTLQELEP